jgi:hypothetical protein
MLCYCYWNFRQSIDLYSSVPSPSIGFLGNSSLTRLSSSFLSTSLTRRHTPEVLPSVTKPLIQPTEEEKHQRRSSHTLLPPLSRRSSLLKKESKISHEVPSRHCSFGQAVLNGLLLNLRLLLLYLCMIYDWKCVYKGCHRCTNRFCSVELDSIHILRGGKQTRPLFVTDFVQFLSSCWIFFLINFIIFKNDLYVKTWDMLIWEYVHLFIDITYLTTKQCTENHQFVYALLLFLILQA